MSTGETTRAGGDSRDERERRLRATLQSSRVDGFAPGFADRVMERVAAEEADRTIVVLSLDTALRHQFRRLVPIAAAAALALVAHNVFVSSGVDQSAVEAALGLQPVTLDAVYGFDPALYATAGTDGSEVGS